MTYTIILSDRNTGDPYHYFDSVLPGILIPDRLWPKLRADFADEMLDLCRLCDMDCHCHPIGWPTGEKYCTILFHDALKPRWTLNDVC